MRRSNIVNVSVDVAAPPEVVWQVMTNFADYGRWNPFVVAVAAPSRVMAGSVLRLDARMISGSHWHPEELVTTYAPPSEGRATLEYILIGAMKWFVRARRTQTVTALADGGSRYASRETFEGPCARFLPVADVYEGTLRHADGLKWMAEGLVEASGSPVASTPPWPVAPSVDGWF